MANISGHLLALPLAEDLGREYTIIALSVPPLKSFGPAAEGLKQILDAESVCRCHVIGHSNGGVYMQSLIAQYSQRVSKIVLSHSLASMSRKDATTTNVSEVKIYKTMRRLLKVLPAFVLTHAMAKTILSKLRLKSGAEDTERFIRLCKQDMKRITKRDLLTMADCMEDFLYNYAFMSEPYLAKPQDVLILDSPTDTLVNPLQRAEMLRLCPNANEYHFESGGHVTMANCRDEYMDALRSILADRNKATIRLEQPADYEVVERLTFATFENFEAEGMPKREVPNELFSLTCSVMTGVLCRNWTLLRSLTAKS